MAAKWNFTQADYTSQCADLEQQIRVAEDDHHRAGYRNVLGEATQDDVDKALVSLDALKNKRRSLDAAWAESQRRSAASALDALRDDQSAALAKIDVLLKARSDGAALIEEAARNLGAVVSAYNNANAEIRQIAGVLYKSYGSRVAGGLDKLSFVQSDIDDRTGMGLVAGLLFKNGVDLSNIRTANAAFEMDRHGSLSGFVEKANTRLRLRSAELCPDIVDDEAEAA